MAGPAPLVFGIETSCDDTACALVDGDARVLASAVSRQLAAHRPFGGVVPEIASREHLANWPTVADAALAAAGVSLAHVDAVAATCGPGLVGSLLVGLSLGKALAFGLRRPFYAVHHLEAHLYSPFLSADGAPAEAPPERFAALVVSGGHTCLYRVDRRRIQTIAETRDDAMGEVFDKLGKRLGLPYPQGPEVDRLAEDGEAERFDLPVPQMRDGELYFSYSGLKSAALRRLEELEEQGVAPSAQERPVRDLLAGFRRAAVEQLVQRVERLHQTEPLSLLAVSGGVAANRLLRRRLGEWAAHHEVDLRLVPLAFAGDNAAMVAHAALLRLRAGEPADGWGVEAASRGAIPEGPAPAT